METETIEVDMSGIDAVEDTIDERSRRITRKVPIVAIEDQVFIPSERRAIREFFRGARKSKKS